MAEWSIRRLSTGEIEVLYLNHLTREIVSCGKNRCDTPEAMIADWMMANADERDLIRLLDRTVLLKLPTASA
ncbi:hypothetical protein D7Y11_06915 [Corallococcus sp. AB018]|uniref:hypothetical protein n=1 Tax=Corallococcus sp. AB018 TaxID=2316715 RepID=UPI000F88F642|nr:hypothetical protein [Corallococcus sp. AB018]RUO93916.1 hypothetical protein D7Y11_06915 [Corallococcus sp. AB018]